MHEGRTLGYADLNTLEEDTRAITEASWHDPR